MWLAGSSSRSGARFVGAHLTGAAGGRLVLIDPYDADGPNLYGTILTDPAKVAASIPRTGRRHMFELLLRSSGLLTPGVLAPMRDAITTPSLA